jgi:amino acid adenylation domain-containing protein
MGDVSLTYAGLNEQANRLAHYLISRHIGPETLVGVCIDRSPEQIVALLAILKAGGAYLPLEPSHPPDRIAFMVADARPQLVLTQSAIEDRLASVAVQRLRLDVDHERWSGEGAADPPPAPTSEQLAYVMYTSGSTGSPKGVMVAHRAVSNHLLWAQTAIPLREGDRVAQKYSIGFDASVLEIFGTLIAGARLVVVPPAPYFDARELARLLRREEITAIDVVPSMLRVLLAESEFAECRTLRRVTCGGEALTPDLRDQFFDVFDAELHNAYGPTEATIGATFWTCRRGDSAALVPIGRPIANTRIYIVDAAMNPVPVGVFGELVIGGEGLARGYLNLPGLTAERFVADPFSDRPGARLYHSGDRARHLADGTIEYAGRLDDQIKLRGIRVEPGEVEASLLRHPAVDACAVVVHGAESDDPQLVAYVAAAGDVPALWPSVGEYSAYDELAYHAMTHDERRNVAYRRAIDRHVAGRIVVDVGTGADAVLARMCVEAGAAHVYAIEVLDEACARARDLVRELGLEEKITVLHGDSALVDLPERVEVCVSELLGTIGSSEGAGAILNDARRFLEPDGVVIPARCVTHIAGVTLPEHLSAAPAFGRAARGYVDRIFDRVGRPFDLRVCVRNFPRENILSAIGVFEELDFHQVVPAESRTTLCLSVRNRGRLDGFLLWISVYPDDGDGIDVLDGDVNWLPVFFPVFHPGLDVQPGDVIRLECSRGLVHRVHPDYRVAGRLERAAGGAATAFDHSSPFIEHRFQASPFYRSLFDGPGQAMSADPALVREADDSADDALVPMLDRYLRTVLPVQMVPSAIVPLRALPLSPSGKIDRKALQAPAHLRAAVADPAAAPRNEVEQRLVEIWGEVLKARHVGIHENFFTDLGGHSLLATQLISRVRDAFQIDLPLRRLFEAPTIAELAVAIEEAPIDIIEGLSEDSVRRLVEDEGGYTAEA